MAGMGAEARERTKLPQRRRPPPADHPPANASKVEYDALGDGVDFSLTVDQETEITGPMAAKLFISSSTTDADLFLVVRVFDPAGQGEPSGRRLRRPTTGCAASRQPLIPAISSSQTNRRPPQGGNRYDYD